MEQKTIVLLGKEKGAEFYELLVGLNHLSSTYLGGNRQAFIDEVSKVYARKIVEQGGNQSVTTGNGFRVSKGKVIRIEKLEKDAEGAFIESLSAKINSFARDKAFVIPAKVGNN